MMKDCDLVKIPLNVHKKFKLEDGDERMINVLIKVCLEAYCILPTTWQRSCKGLDYQLDSCKILVNSLWRCSKGAQIFEGKQHLWNLYTKANNLELCGFFDSYWVGSFDDQRSTSGYVFNLSSSTICGFKEVMFCSSLLNRS